MKSFDVAIIGAGIHGVGAAQALAAAGYSVVVIEKNAIASGTSSKSSKLIHGGLRYLESYQFSLVRKSLKERGVLCRIAPDLVKLIPFYIPIYKSTKRRPWQIRLGLSVYALLGGLSASTRFKHLSVNVIKALNGLKQSQLESVYQYYDGQTDDKKLTQAVMRSAEQLGALLLCPVQVEKITRIDKGFNLNVVSGNTKRSIKKKSIKAQCIVNAAGPWVNQVNALTEPEAKVLNVDLVQGTHIIIDAVNTDGIYYLEAEDQRAVFVMPYVLDGIKRTLIGTTEKLYTGDADSIEATQEEIDYLLKTYKNYFSSTTKVKVLKSFAGCRVLPNNEGSIFSRARDTVLHWSLPGILTCYGGKLTAYRSTSELVVQKLKPVLGKRRRIAYTKQLLLK
ncbi:MAG: glycerol-3-phosphate dehydrogenase/oxidase [Woeseiaceae bacterium]